MTSPKLDAKIALLLTRPDVTIYHPCEICGDAATELSALRYENWGRALGGRLSPGAKFIVGGDVRPSTPGFLAALGEGLRQAGLDVVDLGQLPTPIIHYGKRRLHADGCAIVTASREPASRNGLVWMLGDGPPLPDEVAALEMAADLLPDARRQGSGDGDGASRRAVPRTLDVSFDYVASLQEMFVDAIEVHRHVVVDSMHGAWSGKARRYLHAVFPHSLFSTIHDGIDGDFGGRAPDCSRHEALSDLCEAVYRQRAHLGIAFDGDGDCLALVDNEAVVFSPEESVHALLECLGDKVRGRRFVHDITYSDRIVEASRRFGAEPVASRGGYAFVRAKARETDAILAADSLGHYFHGSLEGNDDALYTACLLIAALGQSGRTSGELRRNCPAVYMTPELCLPMASELHATMLDRIRTAWAGFPQQTIDGLRIDIPGGWVLARPASSMPAMTFRFEGLDYHALENLVRRFCETLHDDGGRLWNIYRAAMGLDADEGR